MSLNQLQVLIWILHFILPVSLAHCLSIVWIWICAFLKTVLWMCPCPCDSLYESVCLYLTNSFALSLLDSRETWRRNKRSPKEIFNRVVPGVKPLTTTVPSNTQYYKHHCLSSNSQLINLTLSVMLLCSIIMMNIHF